MNTSLKRLVSEHTEIFIDQMKEWGEILLGYEGRNRYVMATMDNRELGYIYENSASFKSFITRIFLRSHRPMNIRCLDSEKERIMEMDRPFYFFFSQMKVISDGKTIGSISRRFHLIYKKYSLYDEHGREFAYISSPFWQMWTFRIYSPAQQRIGLITKKWGGIFKEFFTDSDRFGVSFPPRLSEKEKAIVLAATISIDMDFFDNNQSR